MAACDKCGAWVSTNYHRVFEDNDGVLRQCPTCGMVNARWDEVNEGDFQP